MSNYLASLAARSVGKEPPLPPRPLSLFEPWPGVGMGALPVQIPPVVVEEGNAGATAVSAPAPTPSPAPPTVTAPQMVWQTAVQPSHTSPERPPARHPEPRPASITIMREIERPKTPAPPTAQSAPSHIITTIHAAAPQQPIQPAAVPPAAPPQISAVRQPADDDGRSPTPLPPSPIIITPTPAVPQPPANPGQPPVIHHSQFAPSASSGRAVHNSQFPPHAPEPAPIVQVTIGRIEVRATPPPAVREKRQPPSPAMSLDDYLRQRNGDQR